jgi:hypothetical protein
LTAQKENGLNKSLLKIFYCSIMLCCIYSCIYFSWHNFCIDTLYINYLIHILAFQSSSGMHIHYWLHCSPLNTAVQWVCLMMARRPKYVVNNLGCIYTEVALREINTIIESLPHLHLVSFRSFEYWQCCDVSNMSAS